MAEQGSLLPDHDSVWTWDGYILRKRLKKHVDKEIRDNEAAKLRGFVSRVPEKVFLSEADGVLFVYSFKKSEVESAEKKLELARKALARWHKRLGESF